MSTTSLSQPSIFRRIGRPIFLLLLCNRFVGSLIGLSHRQRLNVYGLVIDCSSPVVNPVHKALMFWGLYEHREIDAVHRFMRRDLDVIELGGSIGAVTTHIAAVLEPSRRLISVEANPAVIDQLEHSVRLNSPSCRLTVVNAAFAHDHREDVTTLLAVGDDSTASYVTDIEEARHRKTIRVPRKTLGELLREHMIDDYALVVDIEGGEACLLEREWGALQRCRQLIAEFHECEWDGQRFRESDLVRLAEEKHGFRLHFRNGPVYVFERPA